MVLSYKLLHEGMLWCGFMFEYNSKNMSNMLNTKNKLSYDSFNVIIYNVKHVQHREGLM